jgi:hypothetical protein
VGRLRRSRPPMPVAVPLPLVPLPRGRLRLVRLRPVCGVVSAMMTPDGRNRSLARTPSGLARLRLAAATCGDPAARTRSRAGRPRPAARRARSRRPRVRALRARAVCGPPASAVRRSRPTLRTPSRRARLRRVRPTYGGGPGRARPPEARPRVRRLVEAGWGSPAARRTSPGARRDRGRLPLPRGRLRLVLLRPVCGVVSARMTRPGAGLAARQELRRSRRVVLGSGGGARGTRCGPPAPGRVTLSSLDRGRAVPGFGAGPTQARVRARLGRPGTRPAVAGRAGVTERARDRGRTK